MQVAAAMVIATRQPVKIVAPAREIVPRLALTATATAFEKQLDKTLADIVPANNTNTMVILRLKIWNPDEEPLYNYGKFYYMYLPAHCTDADGDGNYDGADCWMEDCDDQDPDVHLFRAEDCNGIDDNCNGKIDERCQCQGDLNDDGCTNDLDIQIFLSEYKYNRQDCFVENLPCCVASDNKCQADLNFDGAVNLLDTKLIYAEKNSSCGLSNTACVGDFDNDGDVDIYDYYVMADEIDAGCTEFCKTDVNSDGVVDLIDEDLFRVHFGRTDCVIDNIAPQINSFDLTIGSVNVNWNVSDGPDGSKLDRIEIWRADNNASCSTGSEENCNWNEILPLRADLAPLDYYYSVSSIIDNPASGNYWYGIHVVDKAENCTNERNRDCNSGVSNGMPEQGPDSINTD